MIYRLRYKQNVSVFDYKYIIIDSPRLFYMGLPKLIIIIIIIIIIVVVVVLPPKLLSAYNNRQLESDKLFVILCAVGMLTFVISMDALSQKYQLDLPYVE